MLPTAYRKQPIDPSKWQILEAVAPFTAAIYLVQAESGAKHVMLQV